MAVIKTSLAENDARLVRYIGDCVAVTGDTPVELVRAWPNISATVVQSLVTSINNSSAVSNPKASGVTWVGTFYRRRAWAEENDERTSTVYEHLSNTTLGAEQFPYEDRSLSAYTASKTVQQTATREVFTNSKTEPTLTEEYGFLSYVKNIFNRFTGTKTVVTYNTGYGTGQSPENQTGLFFYRLIEVEDKTVVTTYYEKSRWKWVKYTYDITYEDSEGDAYAAIGDTEGTTGLPGSKVWKAYPALWGALNVKKIEGGKWHVGAVTNPSDPFE